MASARLCVRTCVGCRERGPKPELIRIVAGPGGSVRVDDSGSAPGRGAYVHPAAACAARALATGGLARALRTRVEPDEAARLQTDIGRTTES